MIRMAEERIPNKIHTKMKEKNQEHPEPDRKDRNEEGREELQENRK